MALLLVVTRNYWENKGHPAFQVTSRRWLVHHLRLHGNSWGLWRRWRLLTSFDQKRAIGIAGTPCIAPQSRLDCLTILDQKTWRMKVKKQALGEVGLVTHWQENHSTCNMFHLLGWRQSNFMQWGMYVCKKETIFVAVRGDVCNDEMWSFESIAQQSHSYTFI